MEHILCPQIREISLDLLYPGTDSFYELYKEGMFNYILFISALCLENNTNYHIFPAIDSYF